MNLIDYAVIALYLLLSLALGCRVGHKQKNTEDYFLSGRRMKWWPIAIALFASLFSSISYIAMPGEAYNYGCTMLLLGLTGVIALPVMLFVFLKFFYNMKLWTVNEYLENRFSTTVRVICGGLFLAARCFYLGVVLYATAMLLANSFGISPWAGILVVGIVSTVYTYFGGMEAVIWTDVVQTLILLGGALVCILAVVFQMPGGLPQIFDIGMQYDKFSLGPMEFSFDERTIVVMGLIGIFSALSEFSCNQTVVQRYIAAPTVREARKATLVCAFMCVPTWLLFLFMGTCLFAFYQVFPSAAVARMKPDDVFPHFILTRIWPGVGGVIIAACLAAAMSSLSGSINAISTIWTVDCLRLIRHKANDHFELLNAKLASGVAGIVMIAGAWGISQIPRESVYDLGNILGALLCSAGLMPFMLGFFTTRIGNRAILFGMYAALLFSFYNILNYFGWLPEPLRWNIHIYMAGPVCNLVMLAAAFAYSLVRPTSVTESLTGLTVWTLSPVPRKH